MTRIERVSRASGVVKHADPSSVSVMTINERKTHGFNRRPVLRCRTTVSVSCVYDLGAKLRQVLPKG